MTAAETANRNTIRNISKQKQDDELIRTTKIAIPQDGNAKAFSVVSDRDKATRNTVKRDPVRALK